MLLLLLLLISLLLVFMFVSVLACSVFALFLFCQVAVNTSFTDLNAFLKHLVAKTNTNCLTPLSSLDGSSSFLVSLLFLALRT